MANICLPPKVVDTFKQALVAGRIQPGKLAEMTSDERHKFFADLVGDGQAKFVNSEFESKLLLKDQQAGFLRWAKNVADVTPDVKRDLISRIQKLDHILSPEEEKLFLKDLASTKLGIDVSAGEAKQIANMSKMLQEAAAKQRDDGTFPSEADRMAYGHAKVALGGYVSELKLQAEKLSAKELILSHPAESVSRFAGLTKSVVASLDNSAIFRQGWKTLWTNPIIWQQNARQSFVDIVRQVGNKPVMNEIMADIVSRPNYRQYEKMKLALGNIEEEFPSALQNKAPIVGRLFKASETAYEGFLYRTRADVADKLLQIGKDTGVNINDRKELESIGKLVNAMTGRGDIGHGRATSPLVNNLFFSVRLIKSNIDTLTAHQLQRDVSPFVRRQAAINLVKIVGGISAILTVANALKPGSVETDSRSSDFGKIRIGDTTFDMTAGMGSLVVLAMRQARGESKSSTTGIVTKYGSDFGQVSRFDGVTDYLTGKFSPAASVARDFLKGEDFSGNKPTILSEAENLGIPLPISNTVQTAQDPNAAPWVAAMIADGLGISANTYSPNRVLQAEKLGKEQQAFKQSVGDTKFKAANDKFNKQYAAWVRDSSDELADMSPDDAKNTVAAAKKKIQAQIYKDYNFTVPKRTKSSESAQRKSLLSKIK